MPVITTTDELARFCAAQAEADFITVDTEFMRERTYWSRLCLAQIGGPMEAVAVDPLAEGIDLAPLHALLENPRVLKVFHAARQDVEIFVHATGRVPMPMVDTQVMAMVCGFGDSASYETLVAQLTGERLDKGSRFTDWARRPLTPRQVEYALGDVTHLRRVYVELAARIARLGRETWLQDDMAALTDPRTYTSDPEEIWKRLKFKADKPRALALIRALAIWREREAQRLNVPRGRVLKDEALMEIVHHAPKTVDELAHVRGLNGGFAEGRAGATVLEVLAEAQALPSSACPPREPRRVLPQGAAATLDLLKVLLHHVSDEKGVAARLIASSDDLEAFVADASDVRFLTGWRREMFGEQALALKSGALAVSVRDGRIVTCPVG